MAPASFSPPANLTGWSAVDIGCNAGFYSFELVRRGAMVTAINVDGHYLQQARWAAREFGLEGTDQLQTDAGLGIGACQ